jgi:hypothetical protein
MTDKEMSLDEMVELVAQQFTVRAEAAEYLQQYPMLYPYLVESVSKIKSIFGTNVELELRLMKDPELADYRKLFCYIWVSTSVDEALDNLNKFDDEFSLDLPYDVLSHLNFDVSYR